MKNNKGKFYAVWIIFGVIVYYSIRQFINMCAELTINLGILADISPAFIKHSKMGLYLLVWLLIILITFRLLKDSRETPFDYEKRLKIALPIIFVLGFLSQLSSNFLMNHRPEKLSDYLQRYNINPLDFYPEFYTNIAIPYFLIFSTLIVIFYLMLRNER